MAWERDDARRVDQKLQAPRDVLLLLAAAPAVILVAFAVAQALDKHPIVGPEPGTWFHRIGLDVSYGVPLALIALAFIGHAVCDRSSRFAFAAGLLFNTVASIAVLSLCNWFTQRYRPDRPMTPGEIADVLTSLYLDGLRTRQGDA